LRTHERVPILDDEINQCEDHTRTCNAYWRSNSKNVVF
jgi:hypothetical protein